MLLFFALLGLSYGTFPIIPNTFTGTLQGVGVTPTPKLTFQAQAGMLYGYTKIYEDVGVRISSPIGNIYLWISSSGNSNITGVFVESGGACTKQPSSPGNELIWELSYLTFAWLNQAASLGDLATPNANTKWNPSPTDATCSLFRTAQSAQVSVGAAISVCNDSNGLFGTFVNMGGPGNLEGYVANYHIDPTPPSTPLSFPEACLHATERSLSARDLGLPEFRRSV